MPWGTYTKLLTRITIMVVCSILLAGCYVAPAPRALPPPPGVVVVPLRPHPGAVWVAPYRRPNGIWVEGHWR